MRVQVHLTAEQPVRLPLNQNHFLAAAIYNTLGVRPDFAQFLHDRGYVHEPSGRSFKLFVFGPLQCRRRRPLGEDIWLGPGPISWVISSPIPEFLTALAEGLLSRGEIVIRQTRLPIQAVEAEAEPQFSLQMTFTCLSPIVVSRPGEDGGYAHYCTHEDTDFSERVRANLIRKHELLYGAPPDDADFQLCFDADYIARRNGRVTKLIDIHGTKIRGVLAPFTVRGSIALTRIGYACGFGQHNSMGFGCVRVDSNIGLDH